MCQSLAPKFDSPDWTSSSEPQTANCEKVQRKSYSTICPIFNNLPSCPWVERGWTRGNFDLTGWGLFLHSYENMKIDPEICIKPKKENSWRSQNVFTSKFCE